MLWKRCADWRHPLHSTGNTEMATAATAQYRADMIQQSEHHDPTITLINALCPHWQPLLNRNTLSGAAEEISQIVDPDESLSRLSLFDPTTVHYAALGINPLWDRGGSEESGAPSNGDWERILEQENASLLSISLAARLSAGARDAETGFDNTWAAMKREHQRVELFLLRKEMANVSALQIPRFRLIFSQQQGGWILVGASRM
eukprot:2571975-Rhodomonas_salina.1